MGMRTILKPSQPMATHASPLVLSLGMRSPLGSQATAGPRAACCRSCCSKAPPLAPNWPAQAPYGG